jgi:hypothetical protein
MAAPPAGIAVPPSRSARPTARTSFEYRADAIRPHFTARFNIGDPPPVEGQMVVEQWLIVNKPGEHFTRFATSRALPVAITGRV